MYQQSNLFRKSRRVTLLLFLLSSSLFASYTSIYNIKQPFFRFSLEDGNYKVRLYNEKTIDYLKKDGFKLYLPNYVKEYNLAILRFNSIGHINGYLSLHKEFNRKNILTIDKNQINYFTTDYATKNLRQLRSLFQGAVIPYKNFTSLAIEGYNLSPYIKAHLNRWLYFKFDKTHNKKNKLNKLLYSYSMLLDKKLVDAYVKKNYKILYYSKSKRYDSIYTYISHLTDKPIQKNKITKIKHPLVIRLKVKQFLFMKEFGYLPKEQKNISHEEQKLEEFENVLTELTMPESYFDYIMEYDSLKTSIDTLHEEYDNLKDSLQKRELEIKTLEVNSCDAGNERLNIDCLNNTNYLNNYIYFSIKNRLLPSEEVILGYGTGEIFNDIGKYYFEQREYEKSIRYLLKAYVLLKNEKTKQEYVAFNLGVLYTTLNTNLSNKKAIKYFKEAPYKEAYFNLGIHYYLGLGIKENNKLALSYFQKAAKEGLEIAKENSAKMMQ